MKLELDTPPLFEEKVRLLLARFSGLSTPSHIYEKIIELGRELPPMPSELKTDEAIVHGCQSLVFLCAEAQGDRLYFQAASEALISAGLASLLLEAYNGETPEGVLTLKPSFLDQLGLFTSLSPNRSNGLANMVLQMQKLAVKFLRPL